MVHLESPEGTATEHWRDLSTGKFRFDTGKHEEMTAKKWGTGATKALLVGVMAAGLCLGMTAGAFAQDDDEEEEEEILAPRPARLRIVGAIMSNNDVKNILGTPVLGFGGSYDIRQIDAARPINIAFTVDYLNKSRTQNKRKVEASYFAVGIAPRIYFLADGTKLNFYGGAGLLVSFPHYKVSISGTEQDANSTIAFGGKFFGGLEFDRSFFGEVEYILPGKSQMNNLNFSVGYRF